ncbi:vacuolar protein sorting-associated protein 54 [Copidosoma floridanum]|uniref:vacuolar protein sorting-associated protein 54 n=1 Tax=Copidosoma floridanum TaxID=29053 RepID=UPI0006C973CE|nr:vacuolar protein sorting-associated protein 54 [Copidosoma floridanum]
MQASRVFALTSATELPAPATGLQQVTCEHCDNLTFKHINDFIRHLRVQHCSQEGGSFVCRYGYNGVCSSLPVEGVSDKDYVAHAVKHAATMQQQQKKSNGQLLLASGVSSAVSGIPVSWTVYSAAQNLPAVLNDPNRGKQSNFLTKTWGDSFVEKADIPKCPYLPEITVQHLESYLKRIAKRYRKHTRLNSISNLPSTSSYKLLQNFPNLRKVRAISSSNGPIEHSQFDLSNIPKIFLNPNLELSKKENFDQVFAFSKEGLLGEGRNIVSNVKQMQEKLTHYLDIVEVRIAEQVASKSQAFFHAMTSHDVLMEQLTQTITILKALRKNINEIDNKLVKNSFQVLRLERLRCNHLLVQEKLKLIATVHQSQPMIQSLLSTPDYVAALDVISTTQEISLQELNGIHSFRHLGSQLSEMEKLINKMLYTEFERYATADLNRPLSSDNTVLDGDKLVSIISGLLRQKHFQFIDIYKEEAMTTVRAITKQRVIESLADSDCCSDQQAAALEVGGLPLNERLKLLDNTIHSLTSLLHRIKTVHNVIKDTADLAAGKSSSERSNESLIDQLLSDVDHTRVTTKLSDSLISICDYCHERLGNLVSASPSDSDKDKGSIDGSFSKFDKDSLSWNDKSWLSETASTSQVCKLANIVDNFTDTCEKLCGKQCIALRSAFKAQASKFVQKFHTERKITLSHVLDSERWKQADVPPKYQALVTYVHKNESFPYELGKEDIINSDKIANVISIGDEKYAIVWAVLILIQIIHEYCRTGSELSALSGMIGRQLAELLRHYNSRCCQLVLGAGAMQVAGLKTITSTILVLAARSLKLVLWLMPFVKAHFQALAEQSCYHSVAGMPATSGGVALLDTVERDIRSHILEIDGKILTIVDNLLGGQISSWAAKPPVPSQSFRNISRHLVKLHEAVSGILPNDEVQALYRTVNTSFKEKLKEQLVKMNIVNNGGPQHGVVTSELTFYLETLRNLKVFPIEELGNDCLDDVWTR